MIGGLITYILVFALHICMYLWTKKLEEEKCDCSDLWHRNIINKLAILLFCLSVVSVIVFRKGGLPKSKLFFSISLLLGLAYYGIIVDYIWKLKKKNCECSEDWKRKFGYIFSISYLILIALLVVMIFALKLLLKKEKFILFKKQLRKTN